MNPVRLAEKGLLAISLFCLLIFPRQVYADVRIIEQETEEVVSADQSREQVEAFALQKAKRLAVEEAGTYISSLSVVKDFKLEKDEVVALASGVVQARIVGIPSVTVVDGVVRVKVKAAIQVDTSVLDRQVADIMKEKGALKKLEEERKKVRELEERLLSLKLSEAKRLDELNAQAAALERERDQQRLFREEQRLKAQGELKKAEQERIAQERALQERIAKALADQAVTRKAEEEAIAKEQDRVRRAQLENEQRWNDLSRKAQMSREQWAPVDDALSLRQAIDEVKQLKVEIATLRGRLGMQFDESRKNLNAAYTRQIELTVPAMPPPLSGKDPFETTQAYEKRKAEYEEKVAAAKKGNDIAVEKLRAEETLKVAEAEADYYDQSAKLLEPFVARLRALQAKRFTLPEGTMSAELGEPDADKSLFPLTLKSGDKSWSRYWVYKDVAAARDLWKTRAFLKAEGLFQVEERGGAVVPRLTAARVTHAALGEKRELDLETPERFTEERYCADELEGLREKTRNTVRLAKRFLKYGRAFLDPTASMVFALGPGGCFKMGDTFGDGTSPENPVHEVCVDDFYIGKYEVTQGQWEKVMGNNPSKFKNGSNYPVENVSYNDAQAFIGRLNAKTGKKQYRLPTEAEWEYAARNGGKKEKWSGSNDGPEAVGWYRENSGNSTHPVGQKQPNGLGLYDMTGNVQEWCSDKYGEDYYRSSSSDNPPGPLSGNGYVLRGGFWKSEKRYVRASYRNEGYPGNRTNYIGFRLVFLPHD